jgi:hypothetical protein
MRWVGWLIWSLVGSGVLFLLFYPAARKGQWALVALLALLFVGAQAALLLAITQLLAI